MGKIVCCMCGKHIRDEPYLKSGEISHGYYPTCYAEVMRQVDEMISKQEMESDDDSKK